MATAAAETKPRRRVIAPNGRIAKEMAGDFPRYLVGPGGEVVDLSHAERAMLRFRRLLPSDLTDEFDACLKLKGKAFFDGLKMFEAKLAPRRDELVGW